MTEVRATSDREKREVAAAAAVAVAVCAPSDGSPWSTEIGGIALRGGKGCLQSIGDAALELKASRALVVSDLGVRSVGHVDRARRTLAAARLAVEIYDAVSENPTSTDVDRGAKVARDFKADLLVAIGGGSVMDAAKGINFVATNGGRMEDYCGLGKAARPLLPSIAAPTTAGTGSDAQSFALITASEPEPGMRHKRKMACGDVKARFRIVLLDSDVVATAPRRVAALAGLDAIAHAVESFVTSRRSRLSTLYARQAWDLLFPAFGRFNLGQTDRAIWSDLLLGAHLAGAAIEESMLGAAHATANPLTAVFGLAHGLAVSLMLPSVVRFNGKDVDALYRDLYGDGAEALASRLDQMRYDAGISGGLAAHGVDGARLPELASLAVQEWTGSFNPRPLAERDFLGLYEKAW
jgi:alcohol dehydrogenase